LNPEKGREALPRLLKLAAARGLYVEIVALVDTAEIEVDFVEHIKAVGAIASAHSNAILEIANEPWHPTQAKQLHAPPDVRRLAALVAEEVPIALGSAEGDDGYAAGDYVTWHSPRGSGDDGWQHVTAIADGASLIGRWARPAVSDEPIGAGPAFVPGRRDDNPRRFGAAGAVTRLAGLGASFHYEGGLQAVIPAGAELACFSAWKAGLDLLAALPEGGTFVAADELAKVATVRDARSAFGRLFGNEIWVVAVDPRDSAAIAWTKDWSSDGVKDGPGVRLFHGRR
jgi:hypothetical protein